jgi:hypothetical protein
MNFRTRIATSLIAIGVIVSTGASATTEHDKEAGQGATASKSTKKHVKPHSHVEDKGGVAPAKSVEEKDAKLDPMKDKSKHFHPRDGK